MQSLHGLGAGKRWGHTTKEPSAPRPRRKEEEAEGNWVGGLS